MDKQVSWLVEVEVKPGQLDRLIRETLPPS